MAENYVLETRNNRNPRNVLQQNENINILNIRCIKLEDSLQFKTAAIKNILGANLGTVNLMEQNDDATNVGQESAQQQQQLPVNNGNITYCAVILAVSKQNVVIKLPWIKNFSLAKSLNKGLKSHMDEIIFYSKNIGDDADFKKAILGEFDENKSGLYVARVHRYFGKMTIVFDIL